MNSKPDERRSGNRFPDFDEMMTLAHDDPEAFEELRRKQIESFLKNVPQDKRQRLVGLQWKVDQVRKLSHSPMGACIAISNMMRDSLNQLNSEQVKLLNLGMEPTVSYKAPESEQVEATILPFTRH